MPDTRRLRTLLALVLLLSFTLIALDRRDGSPFTPLRSAVAAVVGPAQRAVSAVVTPVGDVLGALPRIGRDRADNARLRDEVARLEAQLRQTGEDRRRVAQLDALLRVVDAGGYATVPAQVVGATSGLGFEQLVTVDAGSRDGIKAGMTVINGRGLVGRVTTVGPFTATVLLVTDRGFSAGARLEGDRTLGVVSGDGGSGLTLEIRDAATPVRTGDRVVTVGPQGGSTFVGGVPVGEVVTVAPTPGALTRTAVLKPYADLGAIDLVGIVVQQPRTDPRDAVLPQRTRGAVAP